MFKVLFKPLFSRLFVWVTGVLDRTFGWHKLSIPLGIVTLIGLRKKLRARNLHDTWLVPREVAERVEEHVKKPPKGGRYLTARTADGTFNDLENPAMGSAGMPFGRNAPLEHTHPENNWEIENGPNPRKVSRELLTRDTYQTRDDAQPAGGRLAAVYGPRLV